MSCCCRIDASGEVRKIAIHLAEFAQLNNCLILILDTMELIEPDGERLIERVGTSRARKFIEDPERYFADLGKGKRVN